MRLSVLCFAAGVFWQQLAALPELSYLALVAGLAALLALVARRWRPALLVAAFLCGLAWAGAALLLRLSESLPPELESRDVIVVGQVSGLPQRLDNGLRFDFLIEAGAPGLPAHVSLAWYQARGTSPEPLLQSPSPPTPLRVHAGERWRFTVRLKRPHGNVNPAGFDFEAWLLANGTRATGTVRSGLDNRRLESFVPTPRNYVAHWREAVRERFLAVLPAAPYVGVLVALSVGDQQLIAPAQWQIFSRSGVTHLVSISGLHVTMFASLAYALTAGLWRSSPALLRRYPAQRAAALAGFAAAYGYCLLSGFAVPAQRTLYMLAVVALALLTRRTTSPSRVLALALLAVLLADPWAVLAAGFWLSFGCVGLLFYVVAGRLRGGHWLAEWARAQWALSLGMIPALLLLFQQFSLVAPLANALAIPVVSFIVTPLALAAAALPVFPFLLELAHFVMDTLMGALAWLAQLPAAVWQQAAPPAWAVALALPGAAWFLAPRGVPRRWLGALLFLPLASLEPERPPPGGARVTILDVGQGLAVHIQTAGHDLLYDSGPAYTLDANSGNRIIVPYLRAMGVRRLDGMLITHQDNDHAGGAESVLEAVPTGWLMSSLAFEHEFSALPVAALPCADGQRWEWDGVGFALLHPPAQQYAEPTRKSNDMSCVLRLASAGGSVLLSGDIEAAVERGLLARHREDLASDVLIVPHQGSRTSSTPEFIAAVGARQAIVAVGYRNRFGHPHPEVVARYAAAGVRLRRTDLDGALSVTLAPGGPRIEAERARRPRYWYGR